MFKLYVSLLLFCTISKSLLPLLPLHFWIPIIYYSLGVTITLSTIQMNMNTRQTQGLASLHQDNYTKRVHEN